MPRTLTLETFDGRLLEGLNFCKKVYALHSQVMGEPDGIEQLRLRTTKTAKRLVEELIPIARYVQARSDESQRVKVRWFSGSQPFDAVVLFSGKRVELGLVPKRVVVEVTMSVHPNEYLTRRLLQEQGGSFGVLGTFRDKITGKIVSQPHASDRGEIPIDLADQIIARIKTKSTKQYPPNTVLIVNCTTNTITFVDEWTDAIQRVREARVHQAFREVFVLDVLMSNTATLYGNPSPEQRSRRGASARVA